MRVFDQLAIGVLSIYLTYYCRKHYSTTSTDVLLLLRDRFLSTFYPAAGAATTTIANNPATSTVTTSTLFEAPTDQVIYVPEVMLSARKIVKAFEAIEQAEGAGARVRRSVGTPKLKNFSPFLMLDHFTIGDGAGFPDHPHRGQETITYLLAGSIDHEDFAGNAGTIHAGDLQFMTAGRGIMHAEMPGVSGDGSLIVGLQLWVDLPTELKFCEPRYRDLRAEEIPHAKTDDEKVYIKIISGTSHGVDSVRDLAYTPVWILDVTIKPGGKLTQPLPVGWNAFVYMLAGNVVIEEQKVKQFYNVVFAQEGDGVEVRVEESETEEARFIIVAGKPLDQPVVQHGPFVLNTNEQVHQAMMDFRGHKNGFERAKGWRSEIGKRMD
ncbi:RNA pol II transcription cofactor [Maublancomyces gigas]|uniref:RNA pol II transcription cofactor n=1 Tax=Discina gigas TaxID=1032678 RepID=A0ABR3GBT5_9PEZI